MVDRDVYANRPFANAEKIVACAQGLRAYTLSRADWTHEAHIGATLYFLKCEPDFDLEHGLPRVIAGYNVHLGAENTDHAGYHETLTQFYIRLLKQFFILRHGNNDSLLDLVNHALSRPFTRRDYPQQHYSDALLWSVAARRAWHEPDLLSLDQAHF